MLNDFSRELNAEQLAVIKHGDGPCVVLAGAGSGKTRTIVYRVAALIARGVAPENILLLTFTNKAANEMMTRIHSLLSAHGTLPPSGLSEPNDSLRHPPPATRHSVWGGTFHSIANRLLRAYISRLGWGANFTILDEEDSRDLMKAAMKDVGIDTAGKRFPSPAIVRHLVSYAANAMIGLEAAVDKLHPKFSDLYGEIARAAGRYGERKRQSNALDFDDLLVRWHELLESDEALRLVLRDRFRHVLVDEYQDTNALQASIVRHLVGADGNITVVGDDAQSIYSFRAADVRNILDFPRLFPRATVYRLETNYRSVPEILDLANDVISRNVRQFPKELKSVLPPLEKPEAVLAPSASREAEMVADRIAALLKRGVKPREIAVLFRAAHHSQALEFELMKRGQDFDYRGGIRFFERAHVKDVLAHLRLLANHRDLAAWRRVLRLQDGIGEAVSDRVASAVSAVESIAAVADLDLAVRLPARAARGWSGVRGLLEKLIKLENRPGALARAVLDSSYADYLEAEYPDAADRLQDLEQLAVFADRYAELTPFLTDATLDDTAHRRLPGRAEAMDRVVLSTVHQAKGLEWEAVFLIHLNDGGFPNKRAMFEEGGLEEERRLFYVAITRAKRHLHLSYPLTAGFDAGLMSPSLFLQEADPHCLRRLDGESGRALRSRNEDSSVDDRFLDDEPTLEIGSDGETVTDPMQAVKARMGKVKEGWRKRNFLGDV